MSFYSDASLVMIPSGYKDQKVYCAVPTDGAADLVFSRASSATRVASNGLIEKVRTNLALQSQNFGNTTVWGTRNGTYTANAGTAPDGTNTAYKVTATDSDPYIYQSINTATLVTASCYIKALGSSIGKNAQIRISPTTVDIVMTGDWQRITITAVTTGATNFGLEVPSIAAIGDEVLIWGFQAEVGDIATDYIATTSAAVSVGPVSGLPRLDYLNSTCPRLLLEPQRSNLITFSEQLNNAAWDNTLYPVTITANQTASPSGYLDADLITPTAALSRHAVGESASGTAGSVYTASAFFKKGGARYVVLTDGGDADWHIVTADLDTATITNQTNATGTITSYGNGWYRVSCTFTRTNTSTIDVFIGASNTASAVSLPSFNDVTLTTFAWGVSLELGAYATSYIPTLGTSVTRVADVAYKSSASALIGTTSGTAYISFVMDSDTSADSTTLLGLHYSTSTSNRIQVLSRFGTVRLLVVAAGSIITNAELYNAAPNELVNVAFTYGPAGVRAYVNGTQVYNTATAVSFNETFDLYTICNRSGIDEYGKGQRIAESLLFKNQVLTNAQLAELTTL